jgi:ABC-type transport system substrate-binding protein
MKKLDKKDAILIVIGVALIISIIGNTIIIFNYSPSPPPSQKDPSTLVVGTSSGPSTLELVECWDGASEDVLSQVVETLFTNDLSDPELPRINLLAESYWWKNATTLHIKLREEILFHDGTAFNASAAKWNLDRLQFLINAWGNNTGEIAHTAFLFMRPDAGTPIINNTYVVGEYNITITLNDAYGPFLNLLTLINTGMLSPTAHQDDATSFIELNTEKIVGTGPFVFENYTTNIEVVFSRWNEYWNHVAYFKTLRYKIYDYNDINDAHQEMLNGLIDFNFMASDQNIVTYEKEKDITVKHYTDDTGIPSLVYQFLVFNTNFLNVTWRKCLSYAINYSYILEDLQKNSVRAHSPISPGFGLSYNHSVNAPNFNLTKAREIMVSMGFGNMGWLDEQWITIGESEHPFLTVNYTYYSETSWRYDIYLSIKATFKLIGVSVDFYNTMWEFLGFWCPECFGTEDGSISPYGWAPDYLDVFNMIEPLFTIVWQYPPINDSILNNLIYEALETIDEDTRNEIYQNIQWYFTEIAYYHVPLYYSKITYAHSADLRGVPYNAMGKFQAHWIWRI